MSKWVSEEQQWMSADDRRNALLKDIDSRMVACEIIVEKLLQQKKAHNIEVLQIFNRIDNNTKHMHTISQQLLHITEVLVAIAKSIEK